jgi:hypothetical protein
VAGRSSTLLPIASASDVFEEHVATPTGLDFEALARAYGDRLHGDRLAQRAAVGALRRAGAGRLTADCTCAPNALPALSFNARFRPRSLLTRAPRSAQDRQQRAELDLGLSELRRRIGAGDDADAGVAAREPPSTSAQRSATQNSPSSLASRPAERPRRTSRGRSPRARGSAAARRVRLAADGGRRVQHAGELDRRQSARQAARASPSRGAGCSRSGSPPAPRSSSPRRACGRSARSMCSRDDRVLLALLLRAQQPLAEVVVDRRVRAASGRAGECDACSRAAPRGGSGAPGVAPMKRGLAAADRVDEAAAEGLAQDAEHRGDVVLARRRGPPPRVRARSSRACPSRSARPRAPPPPRSARAPSRRRPCGARSGGVEQRQGSLAQAGEALLDRARSRSALVRPTRERATVHQTSSPRRTIATSGTTSDAGAKRRPVRRAAAVGGEGEAAAGDQSAAGGPRGGSRQARSTSVAPARRGALEAQVPRSSSVTTAPSAASAERSRSGCSKHIHGSPARREASTTALGSTRPPAAS